MPVLEFGDVFISSESKHCLTVKTSEKAYPLARKTLLSLADSTGLPISLHGESVAETIISMRKKKGETGDVLTREMICTDEFTRYSSEFIIAAWRMGIRDGARLRELAEEIASYLKTYELVTVINL